MILRILYSSFSPPVGLTRFSGQLDCATNSWIRSLLFRLSSLRKQVRVQEAKALKVIRAERSYWAGLS